MIRFAGVVWDSQVAGLKTRCFNYPGLQTFSRVDFWGPLSFVLCRNS